MTSTKATGNLLSGLFSTLCATCLIAIMVLAASPAFAETSNPPLNLGTIIQTGTPQQPASYLKLPQSIPLPAPNPLKDDNQNLTTGTVQPEATPVAAGQISPNQQPPLPPFAQTGTNQTAQAVLPPSQLPEQPPIGSDNAPFAPPAIPGDLSAGQPIAPEAPQIEPGGIARLQLSALSSDDGQILQRGINWRIFGDQKDEHGQLPMLHNVDGGPLDVDLQPGSYIVYAGYGYANLTKRVILPKAGDYNESFNLHAGAMRLNAVAAGDIPLDNNLLKFDIYTSEDSDSGSHSLLVKNVKADHVVKLSQGTYHVVSNYGSANAKVRGDVEITEGKLVNVTMIHNAAKVTLRLVSEPGGEALANTIWTVFTPGGDVVKRAIGAFPTLALAAGDYTAIAKQGNEVYNRDFSVTSGLNREIEVLSTAQ